MFEATQHLKLQTRPQNRALFAECCLQARFSASPIAGQTRSSQSLFQFWQGWEWSGSMLLQP